MYFVEEFLIGHKRNRRINCFNSLSECLSWQRGLPFSSTSKILYQSDTGAITEITL